MIDDHPDLAPRFRAPRGFGPMPGPRNLPASERDAVRPAEVTTSLAVSLDADADQLSRLAPPGTRLLGRPVLTVTATRFENLRWLAGRGYPVLTVTFPVEYVGPDADADGPLPASYLAVLWEGLADPITTGREELGFPKLFADISAPVVDDVSAEGAARAAAWWDGFGFFDLTAEDLTTAPADDAARPHGTLVHRYVPSVGALERADIDQLVYHPRPPADAGQWTVTDRLRGTGRFGFHHARFADVPVQYPVINALADLTLGATGPATLTRVTSESGTVPGGTGPRLLSLPRQPVPAVGR